LDEEPLLAGPVIYLAAVLGGLSW